MRTRARGLTAIIGAAAAAAALAGCAVGSTGATPTSDQAPTPSAGTAFDMALSPAVRSMVLTDEHGRHLTPATLGAQPPPVLGRYLSDVGRANLASPQGATWTVADIDGALTWLTGTHVG